MISDLSEATPEQLLQAAEDGVRMARQVEVDKLELLLAWADLHSGDPQAEPDAVPARFGGPRLIALGGDGTPQVQDLALVEIAIARHEAVMTTRRALADALDLRHRLPQVWAGVGEGRCEVWVVRKVARMARRLDRHQIRIVDTAVAAALDAAPARVLAIAEAKVIEADTAAHTERIKANQDKKGVWFSRPRSGDQVDDPDANTDGNTDSQAGIGTVFARLDEADALECARTVEDLATALAAHATPPLDGQDPLPMDHWRAEAFAMLADPAAVLAFYRSIEAPDEHEADATTGGAAEIVVHVAQQADGTLGPLARVDDLGPRLLDQVRDLLRRQTAVTLTPVIDLHTGRSVNGYEHPTDVKHRTELRTLGDVFPHATGLFTRHGRTPDHDHTTPYDNNGPPGQTGDHNDTPLTRHHHRAKTHLGYTVLQLGPDRWVWGTPHGLYRLVTGGGTRPITRAEYHLHAQQAIVLADGCAA
ncbi:hypothetical protein [Nocardioides nitrophenolicus]|uniref:hypothetical protein n=1 Tax=Nocardioides nitrophenolicus TaxID=60489 RepID=UPI00195F0CD1|nr:hypothetical protein [Nocardioides nitrophenolicus]MBM7518316.1 hypothetical protein [Nocardioides nitrophenolicus]